MLTMKARGFTLLEILITLIILAVGMLGLANLQSKIHVTEVESYQRAHAVLLLQDMVDRINSNRDEAALTVYAADDVLGTDADEEDCSALTDPKKTLKQLACNDRNQWSTALQGASEQRTGGGGSAGGMIGARGCIVEIQKPDSTTGVCEPGIYRVTVAWQGLHKTKEPPEALDCGENLYGDPADPDKDKLRRVISMEVSIGVPRCASL